MCFTKKYSRDWRNEKKNYLSTYFIKAVQQAIFVRAHLLTISIDCVIFHTDNNNPIDCLYKPVYK